MNKIGIFGMTLVLLLAMDVMLGTVHGRDVVILYDTSGSLKWQKEWQEVFNNTNQALEDLILRGQLNRPDIWIVEMAPGANKYLPQGQSLLDPQKKDKLIVHCFDEPHSCEPPFFDKVYWYDSERVYPGFIRQILPDSSRREGKFTFLSLARWSAANRIAGNSTHPDDPFFMIIASDMEEDLGGKCRGSDILARKMSAFEAFYMTNTLLSARHRKKVQDGKGDGKYFSVQVSLVSHKKEEEITPDKLPPQLIPAVDDPPLNPPPPDPPGPVGAEIEQLPEPDLGKDPKMVGSDLDELDDKESRRFSGWWIVGGIAVAGAAAAGGYYGLGKLRSRRS